MKHGHKRPMRPWGGVIMLALLLATGTAQAVDGTPPSLDAFARHDPLAATTNADTLVFRASFSEAVQNVDTTDFTVNGATSATVTSVSAVDASHYDITVSGGDLADFEGTVGLDLASSQNIQDTSGNPLPNGEPPTDEFYSLDNTPPNPPSTPDLDAASDTGASSTDNVTMDTTPTFTGTAEADSTITVISSVDGTLGTTTTTDGNWSFTAGTALSEGVHSITATVADSAGNSSPASSALSLTIDTTAPSVSIASNYGASVNAGFDAQISFSESVTGFTLANIAAANATLSNFRGSGAAYVVHVTPTGSDPSTITMQVYGSVAQDAAGNDNDPSPAFNIDYDSSVAGPLCYVDGSSSGGNTGSPWSDAYLDLQSALGNSRCAEIWVATGIYKPGVQVTDSFVIPSGVALYGGFAGTETQRSQRVPLINATVLSGDIDSNDTLNADGVDVDYSDIQGSNAYNVVTMDGRTTPVRSDTVLDGFTITGGNAQGNFPLHNGGGGLACVAVGSGICSPTLTHLFFSGNNSGDVGGAIYALGNSALSSPRITGSTFRGNHAAGGGGALYADGSNGGNSNVVLANVTFAGNQASGSGGAIYFDANGGASATVIDNVTFYNNAAGANGNTIYDDASSGGAFAGVWTNVIIADDTGATSGLVSNAGAAPDIVDSIIQGGCPTGASCTRVSAADPMLAPLADNGGFAPTMALKPGSPAIGAADDTICNNDPVNGIDQRGVSRPQGAHCDIGAYELSDAIFSDGFDGN